MSSKLVEFSSLVKVNFTDYILASNGIRVSITEDILADIEIEYLTKEEERDLKIKKILDK